MKIIKKIFVLSTSAILGLGFCAGTAFASTTPKCGYEIDIARPIPVRPRLNRGLRRSPGAHFMRDGKIRIYGSVYDAASLTYGDHEEIEGLDIYSYLHKS
mgnify:CR=1 FL=1